jgi:hypothetical protein
LTHPAPPRPGREANIPALFAFASPANKAVVGPIQQFAALLQSSAYAPLLRHADAATLQQAQPDDNTYVEVVSVTPQGSPGARLCVPLALLMPGACAAAAGAGACWPIHARLQPWRFSLARRPPPRCTTNPHARVAELRQLYVWVVRRQTEDSVFAGCWMTDSVTVFRGTVKKRQGFGPGTTV